MQTLKLNEEIIANLTSNDLREIRGAEDSLSVTTLMTSSRFPPCGTLNSEVNKCGTETFPINTLS